MEFAKQIRSNTIKHQITDPEFHQHNPDDGGTQDLRKKWFSTMIRKWVPRKLWDFGYKWVS